MKTFPPSRLAVAFIGVWVGLSLVAHAADGAKASGLPASKRKAKPVPAVTAVPAPTGAVAVAAATNAPPPPPPPPPDPLMLAAEAFEVGRTAEALKIVNDALVDDPGNLALLRMKGRVQRRTKDNKAAVRTYAQILQQAPNDERSRSLAALLNVQLARDSRQPADSARLFLQAADLSDNEPAIVVEGIDALCAASRTADAVGMLSRFPAGEAPATLILKLAARCGSEKLHAQAVTLYEGVVARQPDCVEAQMGLVTTLVASGADDRAIVAATRALAALPDNRGLLSALGGAQLRTGDRRGAMQTWSRLIALGDPDAAAVNGKAGMLADLGYATAAERLLNGWPQLADKALGARVKSLRQAAEDRWRVAGVEIEVPAGRVFAIAYGDVPAQLSSGDPAAVELASFIDQLEFLTARGCTFIGAAELAAAQNGTRPLPAKPVLLSFDGGFASFVENVLPVLEAYGYPSVVSVCTSWTEAGAAPHTPARLMTWAQVAAAAAHPLCTVASFTHSLHGQVAGTPQGDLAPSAATLEYNAARHAYETMTEFSARIALDLRTSVELLATRAQAKALVLAWPDAVWNQAAADEARRLGFRLCLGRMDGFTRATGMPWIERWVITSQPTIQQFIVEMQERALRETLLPAGIRGVDMDLDLVVDRDPALTKENLTRAIDRITRLGVNTVFIQGYSDPDGDGNADAVYFPSRVMPVRADLVGHAVALLKARGISVYVTMPVLSWLLPNAALREQLSVMEEATGGIRPATLWAKRLTPFSEQAAGIVGDIVADLAAHADLDGIVFGPDAILTDREDLHPDARRAFAEAFGRPFPANGQLSAEDNAAWVDLKQRRLTDFTQRLARRIGDYRPSIRTARCVYSPALHYPPSEQWLAQSYALALASYDFVMVLAYAELEDVPRSLPWLTQLTRLAAQYPDGLGRTIFNVQAYDSTRSRWIRERDILVRIRHLLQSGALNVMYSSDDFAIDRPRMEEMRKGLATLDQTLIGTANP